MEQRHAVAAWSESWGEESWSEEEAATADIGKDDRMAATSAVAEEPKTVFPLEEFMNLHFKFTGSYRQHNAALEYFREECEDSYDPCLSHGLAFPNDKPVEIPIVYWNKGGGLGFDRTKMVPWSWQELVAQLDSDSIRIVVQGEYRRSCGVIGCYVAPRPHSYDHTRHAKLWCQGRPLVHMRLPVWDFVIERNDGTSVRLEPQPSTPNVEAFEHENPA